MAFGGGVLCKSASWSSSQQGPSNGAWFHMKDAYFKGTMCTCYVQDSALFRLNLQTCQAPFPGQVVPFAGYINKLAA